AVHGSGYAVDAVAQLAWIGGARVIYWGDLDSHGFAILNRLRTHLPDVESVLMDEATLLAHEDLWVPEPKPTSGTFRELTGSETRALERIRAEGDVRLEQERIPWDTALARLTAAVGEPRGAASARGRGRRRGTGPNGVDDDRSAARGTGRAVSGGAGLLGPALLFAAGGGDSDLGGHGVVPHDGDGGTDARTHRLRADGTRCRADARCARAQAE